jgi:hypothetical protein
VSITVSVAARRASDTVPSAAGARNHHESPGVAIPSTVPAPPIRTDTPTAAPLVTSHHRSMAPSTVEQADSRDIGPPAGSGQSTGSALAMTSPPTTSRTAPDARYHTDPPLAVPVTAPSGDSSVETTARSPA